MRSFYPLALVTTCLAPSVLAEDVATSTQALTLALEAAELTQSETIRIQSIESTLFRSGLKDWDFDIRQGPDVFEIKVAQDGATTVKVVSDPEGDMPEFWAKLPLPTATTTVEEFFERAKAEPVASDQALSPREQYIVQYEVCDVPKPDDKDVGDNGCEDGDPLEEWSVVLKVDVPDTERPKNYLLLFEDGELVRTGTVRVGGNW